MELKAKAKFTNVLKAKAVFERVNVVSGDIDVINTALDAVNEEEIGTTPAEKITFIDGWKEDIKAAITAKGVDMTDVVPDDYDTKIAEISGATGDATVNQVLAGATFSNANASDLTGTMPNIGKEDFVPSTANQAISEGYHDGLGNVAGDSDLLPENIKSGVEIFGVNGNAPIPTGNALVDQVLFGATFSNADDIDLTGTMPNIGKEDFTPSTANQAISEGYHDGTGVIAGDADLIADNIKKDASIFGVVGSFEGDFSGIKADLDAANEEASADVDAAVALVDSNYVAIKAAIEAKDVDMTGVKPSGYAGKIAEVKEWIRPSDWLNFPALTDENEQVMHGLFAVFNSDGNYVAFTAAGNFTVDWGDGIVEDVATGVRTEHEYSYAGLSAATITSEGFKQAIIKVTPQAGQNLTSITLAGSVATVVHSALQNSGNYGYGWLDIRVNAPSLTALAVGGASDNRQTRMLKRFELIKHNITSALAMFSFCSSLVSVPLFDTANVTNMTTMFNGCNSLVSVPRFDTAEVTLADSMFNGCNSLVSVPHFDTAKVTSMSLMFYECRSLVSVPHFDTANVTNMSLMFYECRSLVSVPHFVTAKVTNMNAMFVNCFSLSVISSFDASAVTSFNFMRLITITAVTSDQTNTNGIRRLQITGGKYGINISNCMLSAAALDEFFTNLGTAAASQSIRIANNPGAATCNAALATAKGYTVLA